MELTRELKDVVEHLAQQGVLTPSDTQVIFQTLANHRQTPTAPGQTLSGPYFEARHRALHDRKVHP
jgi:hypothetical protein